MARGQLVKFTNGLIIRALSGSFAEGSYRSCFYTRFKKDGKQYVLKKARSDKGRLTNRLEYTIGKYGSRSGYGTYLPDFHAISKSGQFLLVERCIPAYHFGKREERELDFEELGGWWEQCAMAIFPSFMHNDIHSGNWGLTKKDRRPVIFDLGVCEASLSKLAITCGTPEDHVKRVIEDAEIGEPYAEAA